MRLVDRIAEICPIQGRRYERTYGRVREIAERGIRRHIDACDRHGIEPDRAAIREIIDDAWQGRAVYLEVGKPIGRLK